MQYTIIIDTDNAAFSDGAFSDELGYVLDQAARHAAELRTGESAALRDSNGNTVGKIAAE